MTPAARIRGNAILRRLEGVKNPRVAEVGVLIGSLSAYLLHMRPDLSLVMVDNWATEDEAPECYKATGDVHSRRSEKRADEDRAKAEAVARCHTGRAFIYPWASVDAATRVQDQSLDMVFLDADHSYEGVTADIAAWLPKVRIGGWIGGHDYANPDPQFRFDGVDRAVAEWAERSGAKIELDGNFTWFSRV